MRIVVIGASGFIGSNIFEYSVQTGIKTIGTGCTNRKKSLLKFDLLNDRITEVIPLEYLHCSEPVYGIICSGLTRIDRCINEKDSSYKINVENTIRLVDDLVSVGIIPVFLSTDNVFDGKSGYYNENAEVSPVNEYGRQKVIVEKYLFSNVKDYLVFRLSKIISDDIKVNNLLSEMYKSIKCNKQINCIKGLIFSPTYVNDISIGVMTALEKNLRGLYHLCNSEFFERDELVKQFGLVLKITPNITVKLLEELELADRIPLKIYMDSTRFRRITNINFTSISKVFQNFIGNLSEQDIII